MLGVTAGFEELMYDVNENGGSVQVCAVINGQIDSDVVVNIQTVDDTAMANSDYTPLQNTPLTFQAPNTRACTSISITNDQVYEFNEDFFALLTTPDPTRVTITASRAQTTITIADNDGMLLMIATKRAFNIILTHTAFLHICLCV